MELPIPSPLLPPRRPVPEMPPERLDVVVAATHADLSWLEAWRPALARHRLIIVSAGSASSSSNSGALRVPEGFEYEHYTR